MAIKKNFNPTGPALAPANRAAPQNLLVRRARAANFLADLATGMSQTAVAKKYNVHIDTVRIELRWAEREGFFKKAEDAILHRLVPLAIDVYEAALKKHLLDGNYDAAEKVLKGLRLFSSGTGPAQQGPPEPSHEIGMEEEITWERYITKRRYAAEGSDDTPATSSSLTVERIEGDSAGGPEVVEAEILQSSRQEGSGGTESQEHSRGPEGPGPD